MPEKIVNKSIKMLLILIEIENKNEEAVLLLGWPDLFGCGILCGVEDFGII